MNRAQRKRVKMKLSISAPTGFGKTYSALLLAFGLTNDWTKICVIDTENGSASLYEHLGPYYVIELDKNSPTLVEDWCEAVSFCKANGIEVCITDSMYHLWQGVLSYVDSLGGGFTNWKKGSPVWNKIVDQTILGVDMHFICTIRKKQGYEIEKDEKGKNVPKKIGMEDQVRDGFDYEMTVAFDIINDKHMVKVNKDRTEMFVGKQEFVITSKTGKMILDWCEKGITPEPEKPPKKAISDKALNGGIERWKKGEKEIFAKLRESYTLTDSQEQTLKDVENA